MDKQDFEMRNRDEVEEAKMWLDALDSCPHLIKRPDVNRCTAGGTGLKVCRYELNESCDIFRRILAEEWAEVWEKPEKKVIIIQEGWEKAWTSLKK